MKKYIIEGELDVHTDWYQFAFISNKDSCEGVPGWLAETVYGTDNARGKWVRLTLEVLPHSSEQTAREET